MEEKSLAPAFPKGKWRGRAVGINARRHYGSVLSKIDES